MTDREREIGRELERMEGRRTGNQVDREETKLQVGRTGRQSRR